MADTSVLVVGIVSAVLLVGLALIGQSRSRTRHTVRGSSDHASWMPAAFSDGGSSDCGAGNAGCDGGGGGGGA